MWCILFFIFLQNVFIFFRNIFFKNNMLLLPLFNFYFFTREHLKLYWNNNTLFHPVRVAMWGGKYNFFICTLAHRRKIYIFPMLLDTGLVYSRKKYNMEASKRVSEWERGKHTETVKKNHRTRQRNKLYREWSGERRRRRKLLYTRTWIYKVVYAYREGTIFSCVYAFVEGSGHKKEGKNCWFYSRLKSFWHSLLMYKNTHLEASHIHFKLKRGTQMPFSKQFVLTIIPF